MINKGKIRMMARTSIYEQECGGRDIKISSYYKKDYASLNTWITLIWITFGYLLAAGIFCLCSMESILEDLTFFNLIVLAAIIAGGYLILLIIYGIGSGRYFRNRYTRAKQRVKKYYKALSIIEKMNEEEQIVS